MQRESSLSPYTTCRGIKDLVCDLGIFFQKWQDASGRFRGRHTRSDPVTKIEPSSRRRQEADAAIECINCAICYAACSVVDWNSDYFGPAALNRAWTLVNDDRHTARRDTLERAKPVEEAV